jgi:hypothetical protein
VPVLASPELFRCVSSAKTQAVATAENLIGYCARPEPAGAFIQQYEALARVQPARGAITISRVKMDSPGAGRAHVLDEGFQKHASSTLTTPPDVKIHVQVTWIAVEVCLCPFLQQDGNQSRSGI